MIKPELYECPCGEVITTSGFSGPEECSKCGNTLNFTYIGEADD